MKGKFLFAQQNVFSSQDDFTGKIHKESDFSLHYPYPLVSHLHPSTINHYCKKKRDEMIKECG